MRISFLKERSLGLSLALLVSTLASPYSAFARDLQEIKKSGVLKHIGVPYAAFVTGSGDGMSVEIMKLFAKHIGVKYEYVKADWPDVIPSLIGHEIKVTGNEVEILKDTPVRGDVISNGLTIVPWRKKLVEFAEPYFPNQVWLVTEASEPVKPIKPSGTLEGDIELTKKLMAGHSLMGKQKTCLDPSLYKLSEVGAKEIKLFEGSLNLIAPAVLLKHEAELAILDLADILVAAQKWGGKLKVLGPVSGRQDMAVAFAKESPELKAAYDEFFKKIRADGTYKKIVKKYYPGVFAYFPTFFDPVAN